MEKKLSQLFYERAKKVSPGGVHSPVRAFKGVGGPPIFMNKARGAYIYDVDGNRFLDYCMSWGPLIFGHLCSEVRDEVDKAIAQGWTFGTAETRSLELAELLVNEIPFIDQVRFVNSGTEAVLSALRLARAATGRQVILKFSGCYHGHVDALMLKAGSGLTDLPSPDSAGISASVAKDTIVCPLNDLNAVNEAFTQRGKEIAAVIIEPLPANNGLLIQSHEFLAALKKLCQEHGSLLIFDEVISGFRVAFGGMAEVTEVIPDIVTYGKIIGGGFPVGAYAARQEIMDLVAPVGSVYQAGTLSANPVAMAAGFATLRKLLRESPYAKLAKDCQALAQGLMRVSREHPQLDYHVHTYASLFWIVAQPKSSKKSHGISSLQDIPAEQKDLFAPLFHRLLAEGIYLAPSAYEVGFLSTAHNDHDQQYFIDAFKKAVNLQ